MPPDLKARVKAAAEANNRSMNAEIIATLEEKYPAPKVDYRQAVIGLIDAMIADLGGPLNPLIHEGLSQARETFVKMPEDRVAESAINFLKRFADKLTEQP